MTKQQETLMAQDKNGFGLVHRNRETDAPLLPVDEMERFQQFRPDFNDWILKQTETEAEHRRDMEKSDIEKVYRERRRGQIFGFFMGLCGIIGGATVAIRGYSSAGATIASISIGTLALAFLNQNSK